MRNLISEVWMEGESAEERPGCSDPLSSWEESRMELEEGQSEKLP